MKGDLDWRAQGACVGEEPEAWFPEWGEPKAIEEAAKAVCGTCPVQAECLDYALAADERHGVWGGLNERERAPLRRRRHRLVPRPLAS